jgi:hypothetical protein
VPLLLAQSIDAMKQVASSTEVLPFFQALCLLEAVLVALFFGLWQKAVAARWDDRAEERARWLNLAAIFGGRKDGSHGGE